MTAAVLGVMAAAVLYAGWLGARAALMENVIEVSEFDILDRPKWTEAYSRDCDPRMFYLLVAHHLALGVAMLSVSLGLFLAAKAIAVAGSADRASRRRRWGANEAFIVGAALLAYWAFFAMQFRTESACAMVGGVMGAEPQ